MVKRHRKTRPKRLRPEKLISEREFLTGEHWQKQDLPTKLEVVPESRKMSKTKTLDSNAPIVDEQTRAYLGSGKRPRWFDDCPEKEVNEEDAECDDEKKEKKKENEGSK